MITIPGTTTRRAAVGMLLGAVLARAQAPPSAQHILDKAKAEAQRSRRAIFAVFHASW